ncbi:Os03g0426350, partial [Oryza sativa Japonica Group]
CLESRSSGAQRAREQRWQATPRRRRLSFRAATPLRPSPPLPHHGAAGGLDADGWWQAAAPSLPAGGEAAGRGGALPSAGSNGRGGGGGPASQIRPLLLHLLLFLHSPFPARAQRLEAAATATRSSGLLPPPATASTGDDLHGNELTATMGCRCDKYPSSPLFLLYLPLVAWPIH